MVGGKSKNKDKLVPTTPAQLQEEDEGESDVEDQDDGEGPTVSLHKEVKDLSAKLNHLGARCGGKIDQASERSQHPPRGGRCGLSSGQCKW